MTYECKGQTLEEANRFLYSEEIYLVYPKRFELFRRKTYSSEVPVDRKHSRIYSENHGCYIERDWELLAAPKQYLLSQGYKPKL